MKIGMVGLSLSHPYSFTEVLRQHGLGVDYVWDYDAAKAGEYAAKYGAAVVDAPEEMIRRGVDAVLVCSISGDHARFAIPFIEAGVPTFVDKALATTAADLDAILRAVRQHGTVFMSSSAIRFAPGVVALREKARTGAFGQIVAAGAWIAHTIKHYLEGPSMWQDNVEQGGGSIINMGIHAMDPIVSALGPAIESVFCQSAKLVHPTSQSEDTAMIQIRYQDGRLACIQLLCGTSFHGYYLQLHGTTASAQGGAPSAAVTRLDGGATGVADAKVEYGYTDMILTFVEAVRRREHPIPLEETEAVIKALLAARQSAALGRPVALREIGTL